MMVHSYTWKDRPPHVNMIARIVFSLVFAVQFVKGQLEYDGTACWNATLKLKCPHLYSIRIDEAFYGRRDADKCADDRANSMQCSHDEILKTLRRLCDTKNRCTVVVGVDMLGDPCPGTSKYLEMKFRCVEPYERAIECESRPLTLRCPESTVMLIRNATFGRISMDTCPLEGAPHVSNCSQSNAVQTLASLCNNKNRCLVYVVTSLFGDPCRGVSKYLDVSYTCGACNNLHNNSEACRRWASKGECERNAGWMAVNCRSACWQCEIEDDCEDNEDMCEYWAATGECHLNPTWMEHNCRRSCNKCPLEGSSIVTTTIAPRDTTTPFVPDGARHMIACEATVANLTCTDGQVLRIYSAAYGRRDSTTCPHQAMETTQCAAEDTLQRVKRACEGRSQCLVSVYSEVFGGDPCPRTYKYLELDYQCQDCTNSHLNNTQCELWSSNGDCSSNAQWMHQNCFATCSGCKYSDCRNVPRLDETDCDYWSMRGECAINPRWMAYNCQASCRQCVDTAAGLQRALACEGYELQMSCSAQWVIAVHSAFYGRHDKTTCPHETAMRNTSCSDPDILGKLRNFCNGVARCDVAVTLSVLGEPCHETYKYVHVEYACVDPANMQCDVDCLPNGRCIGDNMCRCIEGYTGPTCDDFSCAKLDHCNGHGLCYGPNICECSPFWTGDACDVATCYGVANCSGRGVCIGVDRCFCYPFYSGDSCTECATPFKAGASCLPCPRCEHGKCVQNAEEGIRYSSFVGCFADKPDDREFEFVAWDSWNGTTTQVCMDKCYEMGYRYAALQDGEQCFCGNTYGRHGRTYYCDKACSGGEMGDVCGGYYANSVWKVFEGYCACQRNWAGKSCDRCADGYSGEDCEIGGPGEQTTERRTTRTTPSTTTATTTTTTTTTPTSTTTTTPTTTTATTPTTTTTTKMTTTTHEAVSSAVSTTSRRSTTDAASTGSSHTETAAATTSSSSPTTTTTVKPSSSTRSSVSDTTPRTAAIKPNVVSMVIILQNEWNDRFKELGNKRTAKFVDDLRKKLLVFYKNISTDVTDVEIVSLRKGSIIVEHEVSFSRTVDIVIEEDLKCATYDILHQTNKTDVDGYTASLNDATQKLCAKRKAYCKNDGTQDYTSDGKWFCHCAEDYTGDQCEKTKLDIIVIVVIIVIVCTIPLLIIFTLCCLLEKKASDRRAEKAALEGTTRSFHYQDMTRARKSTGRQLFGSQKTDTFSNSSYSPKF